MKYSKHTLKFKLVFGFLVVLLFSCRKDTIQLPFVELHTNTNFTLNDVHFVHPDTGYIVGGDTWYNGVVLTTYDAGQNWQLDSLTDKELFALHFDESNKAHSVGIAGHIFTKDQDQTEWEFISRDYDLMFRGVAQLNQRTIITSGIAFQFGQIRTYNAEYELIAIDSFEQEMSDVYFSTPTTAHAVGYGVVAISTDAGLTWERQSMTGDFFRKIYFPSPMVGYAIGSVGGTIIKTTDGGFHWDKIRDGSKQSKKDIPFRSLYFVDDQKGYLVGDRGTFWRTLNGGNDWEVIDNFPTEDLLDVFVVSGKGYVVGTNGKMFQFDD